MKRGFGLIELILALGIVVCAFLAAYSSLSTSSRHAVQSRNRTLAMMLAQSMLEEVQAHPFGQPAPTSWPLDNFLVESYQMTVEGVAQQMIFRKEMTLDNGSFVGKADDDYDKVKITVSWDEITPAGGDAKTLQNARTETAEAIVWRHNVAP